MGATGFFPWEVYGVMPPVRVDPVRTWLSRHLSPKDVMVAIEWQEICNAAV